MKKFKFKTPLQYKQRSNGGGGSRGNGRGNPLHFVGAVHLFRYLSIITTQFRPLTFCHIF